MTWLEFGLIGLATWRLSHLLVYEVGPFGILVRLREMTGIVHDDAGHHQSWPSYAPLVCIWCTSLWVAPVLLLVWAYLPGLVYILALSGLACLIEDLRNDG